MALSAFGDKEHPPSERSLAATLGATAKLWKSVQRDIAKELPAVSTVWGYTSRSTGWSLRLRQGERIIAYLTPCDGHFLASFALGEKAAAAARQAGLPTSIGTALDVAPKYAEGRGLRFAVKTAAEAAGVVTLAGIKARA